MTHECSSHDCHGDIRRTCPFCLVEDVDVPHIASHQRRVAYFSLPRLRMEASETTPRTQPASNISKRASMAPEGSLKSSVHDYWANNVKQIDIVIRGVGSMIARLLPNEEVEAVLVERLRKHFSYISWTEFRFTDSNDTPVPIDYDTLYGSMTIFAHPSINCGHTVPEQLIHKDESTQESPQSSTNTRQIAAQGDQQVPSRSKNESRSSRRSFKRRRASRIPASQDVAVQSPPAQQLPQPQAQPSYRIPVRSTTHHVHQLDEAPSEMYQPLRAEERISGYPLIAGYGPQVQQVSYLQIQRSTPNTCSTGKPYTVCICVVALLYGAPSHLVECM